MPNGSGEGRRCVRSPCDNPARMQLDDRFEELVDSLTGFHRTWLVYLGGELGLFAALRAGGEDGVTAADLATGTGCQVGPIAALVPAAPAHGLADLPQDRLLLDRVTA